LTILAAAPIKTDEMENFMKRKSVGSLALAFLFGSILGHAQDQPANTIVHTPGGKVNVVAKFTGTSVIGDSAISESGGNMKVTGNITGGGTVSGSAISTSGAVSGNSGSFTTGVTAGGTVSGSSISTAGTVSGNSGSFTTGVTAGGTVSGNAGSFASGVFTGSVTVGSMSIDDSITVDGAITGLETVFGGTSSYGTDALNGLNNSATQTLQLQNEATPSASNFIEAQFNSSKATFFTDTKGDTTAIGTKSAAVPLKDGSMVKVFSVEAPEVWFEDYGSGQLNGGLANISLDPQFVQTVNLSKGFQVFLTPKGDCKGLYLANETSTGFEVRELGGGESSVDFDYHVIAHRKGYETLRLPAAIMPTPSAGRGN
jgi:hypothetical protein